MPKLEEDDLARLQTSSLQHIPPSRQPRWEWGAFAAQPGSTLALCVCSVA